MKYTLPDFGFRKLQQDIATLSKKSARLGLDPVVVTETGRTFTEVQVPGEDDPRFYTTIEFTIEGDIPKVNGWTFIGSVEPNSEGNVFHPFPGFEIPERFRTRFICDHCGTQRSRRLTYILKNDNAEGIEVGPESGLSFIQVGSSCLQDFVRETQIHKILAFYENLRSMLNFEENPDSEYRGHGGLYLDYALDFLARVAYKVRTEGWVSRAAADADPSKTATIYNIGQASEEEDTEMADNALLWIRSLDLDSLPESSYMRNLYFACLSDYFDPKHSRGIVASLIPTYIRHLHPADTINNEWVGDIGEKIRITLVLKQTLVVGSGFGSCFVHKFRDLQDHLFVWITQKAIQNENQGPVTVKAKVKKHSEFRGVKQTEISYVSFV